MVLPTRDEMEITSRVVAIGNVASHWQKRSDLPSPPPAADKLDLYRNFGDAFRSTAINGCAAVGIGVLPSRTISVASMVFP